MHPNRLSLDVSAVAEGDQTLTQAAWLFAPEDPASARGVLVCLAGGTYDKHYWHLEVEGHPGYSFGEHLAALGYVVIALDHLGVGDSSDVAGHAGLELLSAGDAEVVAQIRKAVQDGSLVAGVPQDVPIVGVGHSMGACLTTMVQATASSYDAVVLLGYGVEVTNSGNAVAEDLAAAIQQNFELLRGITGAPEDATSWVVPRGGLRDNFYAPDVPEAIALADDSHVSRLPARANAEVISAGFVAGFAAKVAVPVFLGFGAARDTSPDPYTEPSNYPASSDVTLFLVPGSHHCHNMAGERAVLWDRIAAWVPTVTR